MGLRKAFLTTVVIVILWVILFNLRHWAIPGGDDIEMGGKPTHPFWLWFGRAPGTILLHQAVWRTLGPWGWSGREVVALCSSLAGALWLVTLWQLRPQLLFMAIMLCSSASLLFIGHVENYAWVTLGLTLFVLTARQTMQQPQRVWLPSVILAVTAFMHMLAVFYLPALAILLRGTPRRAIERALMPWVVLFTLTAVGPLLLMYASSIDPVRWLLPVWHTIPGYHEFTLFAPAHLHMYLLFQAMSAPLGWPLLVWRYRRVQGRWLQCVAVLAGCGVLWTFVWNPTMGLRDWDLFVQAGYGVNLLAGLLVTAAAAPGRSPHPAAACPPDPACG